MTLVHCFQNGFRGKGIAEEKHKCYVATQPSNPSTVLPDGRLRNAPKFTRNCAQKCAQFFSQIHPISGLFLCKLWVGTPPKNRTATFYCIFITKFFSLSENFQKIF